AAFTSLAACAALGALVGAGDRRGWSRRKTMFVGLSVLWPIAAIVTDVLLFLFSDLRQLVLDQVRNSWQGLLHILRSLHLDRIADAGQHALTWTVTNWWLSVPIVLFFVTWFGVWLAEGLSAPALRRVRNAFGAAVAETGVD